MFTVILEVSINTPSTPRVDGGVYGCAYGAETVGATDDRNRHAMTEIHNDQDTARLLADDDGTLGPCGCTDYHMADCPIRTGARDAMYAGEDDQDRWYGDDA